MKRVATLLTAAMALAACDREERRFRELPPAASAVNAVSLSDLEPGGAMVAESTYSGYDGNAFAISQGYRLFNAMNCVGCHANGGGGMGPALMDENWIYGSDPSQIFKTIVEGRPNGMPTFKGKLSNQQVWQITAYIRALSGLASKVASPSRPDHLKAIPNLQLKTEESARKSGVPPASKQP